MQSYDPMSDPDPKWWLALDEDERINAVMEYHERANIEVPDAYTHALLHVVIENQVAMGEEAPTESVLRRLLRDNLDRHDAVHAIACVFTNHMHEMLYGGDSELSNEDYCAELEKLTAEKWSRGDYSQG